MLYTQKIHVIGENFKLIQEYFESRQGGALLFNGDLDYNSPYSNS